MGIRNAFIFRFVMLSKEESLALADLLFPDVTESIESVKARFPARSGIVTRFAPSPTGFLHIGALLSALIPERIAHQDNGTFFLRIEDTDQKREVENGIGLIVKGLRRFGIRIDEGPIGENLSEIGNYGPYVQSQRKDFYHVFAKELVKRNLAYPCFLTEPEIAEIREVQEAGKRIPGIYGKYSPWSFAIFEEIKAKLETGTSYVLRFRCPSDPTVRVTVMDEIRGKIEMQDNFLDVPVLKSDGIPTYHFAHIVDDTLMGTTHVIRAEEWLPSLPLHVQLFKSLELTPPKYAHVAQLLKMDEGNKRKLSKRKDPEANVEFFYQAGYPVEAIKDYLLNIIDSSYEGWKLENPGKTYEDFRVHFDSMPKSGALFDMKKLESISHGILSALSNEDLFNAMLGWAAEFDPEFHALMQKYPDVSFRAVSIQRHTEKDPKKFRKYSDAKEYLVPFIPELYEEAKKTRSEIELPFDAETVRAMLADYQEFLKIGIADSNEWVEKMRENAAVKFKIARDNAEFKAGGCIGKFGDYAMVVRVAIAGSKTSPDLFEMIQVLGIETAVERIDGFIGELI